VTRKGDKSSYTWSNSGAGFPPTVATKDESCCPVVRKKLLRPRSTRQKNLTDIGRDIKAEILCNLWWSKSNPLGKR